MDLSYGEKYEAFRASVQDFLAQNKDSYPKHYALDRPSADMIAWQKKLIQHGYAARTIPAHYGGFGAAPDILEMRIIVEEFVQAQVPRGLANQGISMFVPTLLEAGTEEQKQQWVKPTIEGEVVWCQGYSEPNAGSDLASLKTAAIEEGNDFIINGQKIWTSTAASADMMFLLVRTEAHAPKHQGISYVLVPMNSAGIEVRPLKTMTGAAEFNEVFFTDLRVPQKNVVGKRGEGWKIANTTLRHERYMLGDPNQAEDRLNRIMTLMKTCRLGNQRLIDLPVWRKRLIELQAEVMAMGAHGLRLFSDAMHKENSGVAAMIVKLQGCELNYRLAELAIDVMGIEGIRYGKSDEDIRESQRWQRHYMFDLGLIIGGGTSNIQKNIIAERGLGLPKEPKAAVAATATAAAATAR